MHSLTLQLYLQGDWHDAMRLDFEKPDAGLLSEICLPKATFQHPRIALNRLDTTLKNWGLR
jgi:hypothetical protein